MLFKLSLVIAAFAAMAVASSAATEPTLSTTGQQSNSFFCIVTTQFGPKYWYDGSRYPNTYSYAVVTSELPADELTRQFTELVQGRSVDKPNCYAKTPEQVSKDIEYEHRMSHHVFDRIEFVPKEDGGSKGKRRTASVPFDDPNTSLGEKGFAGVVFDVDYQFIACSGELHIAYSLVEDSVGIGRLAGGGDRVTVNGGRGRANYWLDGKVYKVEALPEKIINLPLKGAVWMGHQDQPLGRFADDHAGKALGFGCFSGQTKKIANLKDLNNGESPTKDELPKILEKLRVNFATNEILTSSAAEEEIRTGLALKGDPSKVKQAEVDQDRGPSAADLAAEARAKREAEFQAKQAEYEKQLAAQQKAVADFDAATKAMEEQKAAAAAAAKAALDEFARKQAAHQAEVDRLAQERAAYDAQFGVGAVTVPKQ